MYDLAGRLPGCTGVSAGRNPDVAPEMPGEVALVEEACLVTGVAHRPAVQQQPFGPLDPQLDLVGVRRHPDARGEQAGQPVRAQLSDASQFGE